MNAVTMPAMNFESMDFKFIAYANGLLLVILSGVLLTVGFAGYWLPDGKYDMAFAGAAMTTAFFGGSLCFANRQTRAGRTMSIRTSYLLTFSCWIVLSLFSTLPLYFSGLGLSFTDALFETVSALTTTGSTVLTGLDTMPPDILLWRSILQWLGGIGIIVMAMALLPLLRVGGMNLFKSESSDISGKVVARMDYFVRITIVTYIALTVLCAGLMRFAGMSWFDAVNHAMTTISTGGLSTHDASIGHFQSLAVEMVTILFMLAGALPIVLYARLLLVQHRDNNPYKYTQVRGFLMIWLTAVVVMSLWNWLAGGMSFGQSLRLTTFNVTSVITDTGFATADFSAWGSFPVGMFFCLYFVGGCAGSTSGAIKIFRWQILLKTLYAQFVRNLQPNTVIPLKYAGHTLDDRVLHAVRNFFFLYLMTFAFFSLVLMGFGVDFLGSVSSVAQAMANAGPALTGTLGPAGNFASLPDGAKWVLDLVMIIGRLEMFTVYVLFLPIFWRA